MMFSVGFRNREKNCRCVIFETDSQKVAKKTVEAMSGAPCKPNCCENVDKNCHIESVKNKK